MKEWREAQHKVWYYYKTDTGQIIGQVSNITHTDIYTSKVYIDFVQEKYLGQYINSDFARKAVENFWSVQERTLTYDETSS